MKDKIVVTGNPVDGFHYYGPFSDDEVDVGYFDFEADWWVAKVSPLPDLSNKVHETILVAFETVCEEDHYNQKLLIEALKSLQNIYSSLIESFWIAEDFRMDGSDNQSAVFIPSGMSQLDAVRKLNDDD